MIGVLVKRYWLRLVTMALFGMLVFLVNHYRRNAIEYKSQIEIAEQKLQQSSATITDIQERQKIIAALDAKHIQELADANAKNDELRHKLDAGGRVRVAGKCSVSGTDKASGAGGVGNDASIELSDTAGRNVLGIRSGIISDQQKVKYLQDYISTQCLE